MSYQGQDPNQRDQYPYSAGYTPPQPNDPYSNQQQGGQQYGQGGYQQTDYGQQYQPPNYGQQQQPYGAPSGSGTSMGMPQNVEAALSYLFGWVTGLIFFLVEKQNRFVRFHAMQSILFFGGLTIVNIILGFLPFGIYQLSYLVSVVAVVGAIILMVNAYQGKNFKLPYIGDYAEKLIDQIKV